MANNKTTEGLERLNELGVVEEKSHHYLSAAAKSYANKIIEDKKCLLVSPTHREIDTLNALVRKEFSDEGILDLSEQQSRTCFQDHNWTRDQIASPQTYRAGNAIRFNTPLFGTEYQKHDILVIERIEPSGEILLDDERTVPADFESISYGYATTSHKSQGSTCDHAILAAAQMSNRACYVGSSRGRQSVKVFTPDFEHLYASVKRNSEHLTGHDLIATRQEYINDISPKQDIENIPKNEEILQGKDIQENQFGNFYS